MMTMNNRNRDENVRHRFCYSPAMKALLLFCALIGANCLSAGTIDVLSVSGNANSLYATFQVTWGPNDTIGTGFGYESTVNGTVAGGEWRFSFGVGGTPPSYEPYQSVYLRTSNYWNDGWDPGAIGFYQNFDYGGSGNGNYTDLGGGIGSSPIDLSSIKQSPQIADDFSGLGLEYYLTATLTMDYSRPERLTGVETFTFSIERTRVRSVPDSGTTLALLGGAFLGLATFRRRFVA